METNLSRAELLGLARMFYGIPPGDILTETLPARLRMLDGISYLEVDEEPKKARVNWLLRGDEGRRTGSWRWPSSTAATAGQPRHA